MALRIVAGMPAGVDQCCRSPVVEEEQVAVRGMRVVRMVPHVARQRLMRVPALSGRVGELARIEAEQLRERPRRRFVGCAVAFLPFGDLAGREAAPGG